MLLKGDWSAIANGEMASFPVVIPRMLSEAVWGHGLLVSRPASSIRVLNLLQARLRELNFRLQFIILIAHKAPLAANHPFSLEGSLK